MKLSLRLIICICLAVIIFLAVSPESLLSASSSFNHKITNTQIKKFIKTPIPKTPVVEKIVFAINKDFADEYADWQQRANRIVEDINIGFAKTTKKRFEIGKYITYEFSEGQSPYVSIQTLADDPSNYFIPDNDGSCNIGRMLIYLVVDDSVTIENFGGGNNYYPEVDKVYGFAVISERKTNSTFLKEEMPYALDLESTYWLRLKSAAHELGHSLGLATPDWYQYEYVDLTSVPPELPPYSLNEMYPFDPQTSIGSPSPIYYPDKLWEFSDLNAFIINHGLCKSFTTEQFKAVIANTVVVRVKDKSGNVVRNANVDVYGIDNKFRRYGGAAEPSYFILKQSVRTNKKGTAKIKTPQKLTLIPPVTAVFDAEIIKVSKDGKYGGDYLTIVDLQQTRLLKNKTVHYLDIVIK